MGDQVVAQQRYEELVALWKNADPDRPEVAVANGFPGTAPLTARTGPRRSRLLRDLVGLGSYWVNAVSDCNGCHSAGPATEYIVPTGNPYLLSPPFSGKQQINPKTYLGGGRDFGPFPGPPFPSIAHLYSRNLTPDHTGLPEGGHTFNEFRDMLRHGTDFDHLHPKCTAGPGNPPNCLVAPFNGDLLQVMPWPVYQHMTDRLAPPACLFQVPPQPQAGAGERIYRDRAVRLRCTPNFNFSGIIVV